MAESEMVKLIVSVPRELKERLDAVAKEEDRPLASVVRRFLTKAVAGVEARTVLPPPGPGPRLQVAARPVGGQDAAAGKGVEEREEALAQAVTEANAAAGRFVPAAPVVADEVPLDVADMEALKVMGHGEPPSDLRAPGSTHGFTQAGRPEPQNRVVIGGPDCTHPERFKLGRRCEAPGCGKAIG